MSGRPPAAWAIQGCWSGPERSGESVSRREVASGVRLSPQSVGPVLAGFCVHCRLGQRTVCRWLRRAARVSPGTGVPGQSVGGILQAAGRTPVPRPVTPHTAATPAGARRAEGQAVAVTLTCSHVAQAGQRVGRVRADQSRCGLYFRFYFRFESLSLKGRLTFIHEIVERCRTYLKQI